MTAVDSKTSELAQIDDLIRWMAGQGATLREVKDVLAEAGLHEWSSGSRVYHRARTLGVRLRPEVAWDWQPLPMAMAMFPRLSPRQREALAELAEITGLTETAYLAAKSRILREGS